MDVDVDVDGLVDMTNNMDMNLDESIELLRAYRCRITDSDVGEILDGTGERYKRYIKHIADLDEYRVIRDGIADFLRINIRVNPKRAFDVMKTVDSAIVELVGLE